MLFSIRSLASTPLVGMFHSSALNSKINRIRENCLRLIIYKDKKLTFKELLKKDDSVSIHMRNLKTFVTEMYKVVNGGCPENMKEIFRIHEENRYNSRHQSTFKRYIPNSVCNGTETVLLLGPKIWELQYAKNELSYDADFLDTGRLRHIQQIEIVIYSGFQ